MSFLDMAHDGGYRGQEAKEVARLIEYEEQARAYAQATELEELEALHLNLLHEVHTDDEVPF